MNTLTDAGLDDAMADQPALTELEQHEAFIARHIGTDANDQATMLAALGYPSREALIDAVIPAAIRRPRAGERAMALPAAVSEAEALAALKVLATKNKVYKSFIGQGYSGTHTPGVILRNVLENPAWYTAYTPYQPEISQGRLEAIINFQTMVTDLTGMDVANASMLDEATAAAEAMALARRVSKSKSQVLLVAADCHPQTIAVVRTRAEPLGIEVRLVDLNSDALQALQQAGECFALLAQYPGTSGAIHELQGVADALHAQGALLLVAADLLALTLLTPPGEWGADVVVGSSQRFGVPMGFGGPHAAFFAVKAVHQRQMPGRLVGVTVDANGDPAYRLALQTREQHIRREKATSNICTAQVLLAVIASMYAVYHGPQGLRTIAQRVHRLAASFAAGLSRLGFKGLNTAYFDNVLIEVGPHVDAIIRRAEAAQCNLRRLSATQIVVALDETHTRDDVIALWKILGGDAAQSLDFDAIEAKAATALPIKLQRHSAYLTHPVFNTHRTETSMLRYLRQLADKDIALDRAMIPLGSCTMKLNATSEMLPVTWPEFGNMHPYAPPDQSAGYREMIAQLEAMLCQATGYAAVSLQPNAGSQGEYAGLLIIRAWHASRGQAHRNVCLIPSSAHGTNPASAQMAGMQVVVVACDDKGNVDLADLEAKAAAHADDLSCIMITYPSTHGVFEEGIQTICSIVHNYGGQVYIDGANMNALVGTAAPGHFGGDVSHLNLHKTFCIPHGGGGPGVGPVAVAAHLVPFLPRVNTDASTNNQNIGLISAAPYGSASILPISWMYIVMMGGAGLTAATESAILAANYIAARLAPHYPVLYKGDHGLVAHECILDLRPLKETSGITVDDVAKRLIDYGFHAPTMSFPVAGTLMIEPTESEPLAELDRFIQAMIAIRAEIRAVESGALDRNDNPLKHAPHTAAVVIADAWPHTYARELAAYPLKTLRNNKYWPPVGRADNVYGDRNLFCSCIPIDAYEATEA